MNRLPFVLPEWTRLAWAGQRARDVWEPRVAAIGHAWRELGFLSVAEGLRSSQLDIVAPEDLPALAAQAAQHGLVAVPLARMAAMAGGRPGGIYAARTEAATLGQPWRYHVAVTRPEAAAVWPTRDEREWGRLLGYPECCIDFFLKYWVEEAWIDTTYPMARAGTDGPAECNILLRWLGARLVNHLPCSFSCEATAAIGREYEALGVRLGFEDEMAWLRQMLRWPVQWSALHGIAEILTPVCRISTVTDATAEKEVVQRLGDLYPEEGAQGTVFPFARPGTVLAPVGPPSMEWAANGFTSLQAMLAAHRPVLAAVKAAPLPAGRVLDLGCGDGRLLQKAVGVGAGLAAFGVECVQERAARAVARLGAEHVRCGNLAETGLWAGDFALCILMPGRLQELSAADRIRVLTALQHRCAELVVYAYPDNLTGGGLAEVVAASGLQVHLGEVFREAGTEAARATWA